jgi:S1-C subfamily serine protease
MNSACLEAMRIIRTVEVHFPTGPSKFGSAFLAPAAGRLVTCAHVVLNEQGQHATRILVSVLGGARYETSLSKVDPQYDLATLNTNETESPPKMRVDVPEMGDQVIFAGLPQGLAKPSVFPGMVSAVGSGLLASPRCELIQLAGMINNGNSGGPLLDSSGAILGVITAKYVPLLREIDRLTHDLDKIPQFPRDVTIGQIDFSAFVNVTIKSMWQLGAVLRLVQVGTGWAVPGKYLDRVGGR